MFDQSDVPSLRDDLSAAAVWAAQSVPVGLSARRPHVKPTALALVLACLAAPLLGAGMVAVAIVVALAVIVRLVALVDLLRNERRADAPVPRHLPRLTILLPLKGEAAVVPGLAAAIRRLDYPAWLIEVVALVEEGDAATLSAVKRCGSPGWRVVIVPPGRPRNKPRACNVGLALATGDVVVIFDGEDRPDPDQARKAVAALATDRRLAVVQARLGCDHATPAAPLLARFWALEYAVLFGAVQPALARLGLPFLLGGTSNWFRIEALRAVGGWDAHNVTEDADLGIRLSRAGWRSSVINSTTWEEAPIRLDQWMYQRSRWLKGFAVTAAVHLSRPLRLLRDLGVRGALAIVAQLPATLLCVAAHPLGVFLLATGRIEGPLAMLAMAVYAVSAALHLVVARRSRMSTWLALAMPLYWLLQSAAFAIALADLARDPTHWRKTQHGLAMRPRSMSAARCGTVTAAPEAPPQRRE